MGGKSSKANEGQEGAATVPSSNKKKSEVKLYQYDLSDGQMK